MAKHHHSRFVRRLAVAIVALQVVAGLSTVVSACSRNEAPPPAPPAKDDDEEKPKKKKTTRVDDDELQAPTGDVGVAPSTDPTAAVGTPKVTGTGTAKPKASDTDKAKLQACCTALHNAATAAGAANAAASAIPIPGLPAPPPKAELDKATKACDAQIVNWTGDLNTSLQKVKGAAPVTLPSACLL